MKFCPKCKELMQLEEKNDGLYYVCPSCGYEDVHDSSELSISVVRESKVLVLDRDTTAEPVVKVECPKCGNNEAYTWIVQTRSGDEGGTVFYRCTKCKYTWRIYT